MGSTENCRNECRRFRRNIFAFIDVITSFKDENAIGNGPFCVPFVDFTPSLESWSFILTYENDFLLARLFNSVIVGITSTALTVLVGGIAVYGLTRFRYALPWTALVFGFLALVLLAGFFSVSPTGLHFFFAASVVLALILAARLNLQGPVLRNHAIVVTMMATRILPPWSFCCRSTRWRERLEC